MLFEQQQENLHNAAVVLGAGVVGQQGQQLQQQHNIPEKAAEDENIIIHLHDIVDEIIVRNQEDDNEDGIIDVNQLKEKTSMILLLMLWMKRLL